MDIVNKTVSVNTIAEYLNLSPRRVQQLASKGIIPKVRHGKYELLPALHGYLKQMRFLVLSYRGQIKCGAEEPEITFSFEELNPK